MSDKTTLTYTALRTFMNCRRKYSWRFIHGLIRIGYEVQALQFGSAVHEGIRRWDSNQPKIDVLSVPIAGELAPYYIAAMTAYINWYADDDLGVVASEEPFQAKIINPKTKRASRAFEMRGRIDARTPELLIERKTTVQISASYLVRLWTDRQIQSYTLYLRQNGFNIKAVLYDVIGKANIRIRKNESPIDFQKRLDEKYADGALFTRQLLYFSDDDLARVEWEIWELTQQILDCRRRGVWYQNPSHCFHWNRACQYYPICRSNDNPIVIENQYEYREPHEELDDDNTTERSTTSGVTDETNPQSD